VAALDPEHLFQQAEGLVASEDARQVDIRRAFSAAYYAIFHAIVTAAADLFVGEENRANPRYGLAYRSVEHRGIRSLCDEIAKPTPGKKYKPYGEFFGGDLKAFAVEVTESQNKRYTADYDPMAHMTRTDAIASIRKARAALEKFRNLDAEQRAVFLSLLFFPPRGAS
jgi:uncharacterized protein (UPF0332 family)